MTACDNYVWSDGNGEYSISDSAQPNEGSAMIIERLKSKAQLFCVEKKGQMVFLSSAGSDRPGPPSANLYFSCTQSTIGEQPQSISPPLVESETQPSTSTASITVPPPRQALEKTYRLVVSFNSFASGTDPVAVGKMETLIAGLEKEQLHPIEKEVVHWGREGEFNYCFKLADMNANKQATFIDKVKAELGSSNRASIQENTACR